MDLSYEKIFRYSNTAFKLTGSHPETKITKRWIAFFILIGGHFTSVFILALYTIFHRDLQNKDFSKICQEGTLCVVYIIISFKYVVLIGYKRKIGHLMEKVKFDYEMYKQLPIAEQSTAIDYAKKGQWVCKQCVVDICVHVWIVDIRHYIIKLRPNNSCLIELPHLAPYKWFVLCLIGGSMFTVKNFFLLAYTWYKTGILELLPIYDLSYYFSVLEENKNSFTGYVAIIIYTNVYVFYSCAIYVAFVPFGPGLMLHACGLLELVRTKIDVLFEDDDEDEIGRKLRLIIIRLQDIYSFVAELESVLKLTYELTVQLSCIILPITCFEIIETLKQGVVTLEFYTFIAGGTLIIACPCYYSSLLIEKGENIQLALYSCGWEKMNHKRIRRIMLIILFRTQRSVAVKTPFSIMNLSTLANVFHKAYALFNLMNAAWK